jgi:hypothetical protein
MLVSLLGAWCTSGTVMPSFHSEGAHLARWCMSYFKAWYTSGTMVHVSSKVDEALLVAQWCMPANYMGPFGMYMCESYNACCISGTIFQLVS